MTSFHIYISFISFVLLQVRYQHCIEHETRKYTFCLILLQCLRFYYTSLWMQETYLNIINATYHKPTTNTMLNGDQFIILFCVRSFSGFGIRITLTSQKFGKYSFLLHFMKQFWEYQYFLFRKSLASMGTALKWHTYTGFTQHVISCGLKYVALNTQKYRSYTPRFSRTFVMKGC